MDHSLSLSRRFFKGHGHGNDYLVFEEGCGWPVTSETVQQVCDRWRGPGSDGIVALLAGEGPLRRRRPENPFRLRMFNPDGSEFERSGNGLRILGAYLYARGRVREGDPFPVEVGGETVEMEILSRAIGGRVEVAVQMGRARFGMESVGGRSGDLDGGRYLGGPNGERLDVQPVSVGNPHCVTFRDLLTQDDLHRLGPFLTGHAVFTRGINVQLARVTEPDSVDILIWERGVGQTSSSGTSACAVAAACVRRGLLKPGRIRVGMEGGDFWVTVSREAEVRLEGPVRPVMDGELTPEFQKCLLDRES